MYGDGECVRWIFVSWGSFFVIFFWRCVFVRMDKCRDFGIVRVVISLSCMHLFYHRLNKIQPNSSLPKTYNVTKKTVLNE